MTLYEYIPFFGYLENADEILGYPNYTSMRGERELLSNVLALEDDDKLNIVLDDYQIRELDNVDYFCFTHILRSIDDNEKIICEILKRILNNYEDYGGYPLDLIHFVLHDLSFNTQNYEINQQTCIETFFTQSLVNYQRNPYRKNRLTNPHIDEDDDEDDENNNYNLLKTFFLKQYDVDRLLVELKEAFTIEKGKDIRIIIEILKDYNILIINDKKFKMFYECLKGFLNRNIGSYASINDYKNIHSADRKIIKVKIDDLLKRIS
jgi:hypothetical protein